MERTASDCTGRRAKRNLRLATLEIAEHGPLPHLLNCQGEAFHQLGDNVRAAQRYRQAIESASRGSAEMLEWLVHDQEIAPHIRVFDKSKREDGTFSREDFTYDPAGDLYRCPGGHELKRYRRAFASTPN